MGADPAFISGLFGARLARSPCMRGGVSRTHSRRARSRPARVRLCADGAGAAGGPDFDELARRLASELQGLGVAPAQPESDAGADAGTEKVVPFEITLGNGGLTKIIMRHAASAQEVEIYTYGACVTSWTTRGDEHLWLSEGNEWRRGGPPIRGGIPLCFPQFGGYGALRRHGFARVVDWGIRDTIMNEDGTVSTVLVLGSEGGEEEVRKWKYEFEAEYTVTLSGVGMEGKLAVRNCGGKSMPFTFAFHNYFRTAKVDDARIYGVEGSRFNDRLDGDREKQAVQDDGAGVMLSAQTDRVYLNVPDELAMFDFPSLKVLKIKKTPTLPNATVWNPYGAEGCDPGWEKFVCIEPAAITPAAVVKPGETWVGAQLLGVE